MSAFPSQKPSGHPHGPNTPPPVPESPPAQTISPERHTAGAAALQAWREAGGQPGPRRNPIEKAADNPTSLRLAVNAKCYDCIGQDADPHWQRRVGTCGCTTCPLHAVRPYQRGGDDE
jgi:hypothetical protein